MAEFTINVATWNPTFVRIPVDQLTAAGYDFLAPYMTAAGQAKLKDLAQRSMAEAERTDGSASEYLHVLAFGAFGGSTSSSVLTWPNDDADLVTDKKLTDRSTKVDFAPTEPAAFGHPHRHWGFAHVGRRCALPLGLGRDGHLFAPGAKSGTWLIEDFHGQRHGSGVAEQTGRPHPAALGRFSFDGASRSRRLLLEDDRQAGEVAAGAVLPPVSRVAVADDLARLQPGALVAQVAAAGVPARRTRCPSTLRPRTHSRGRRALR